MNDDGIRVAHFWAENSLSATCRSRRCLEADRGSLLLLQAPLPLSDRFRIIRFPEPGTAHMSVVASSLMRATLAERGLDGRWAMPLDDMEIGVLAAAWQGGPLRKLARLVEGVLAVRDRPTWSC